ncbi:Arm DNA-binding domain-containing protein [Fundidesulfovibrio soli]|uniref:Arm DNA-binding domain-containing protein n=1 Tax=Fundidesulfovibrio soli TaxID=2922716 RepID=UPI001FAECBEB
MKNAKPGPKPCKLPDERGLVLEVRPNGGKWWRLRYSFEGKEKMLSLGVYPDVGLKDARQRHERAPGQAPFPAGCPSGVLRLVF